MNEYNINMKDGERLVEIEYLFSLREEKKVNFYNFVFLVSDVLKIGVKNATIINVMFMRFISRK